MSDASLYRLQGVGKEFQGPAESIRVLDDVNLEIQAGEALAVLGSSGSGKSTLLHILGSLDTASEGSVFFDGRDLKNLGSGERAKVRNEEIGFVFQFHHLLPEFSALENVAMPAIIRGMDRQTALDKAREALLKVDMGHRMEHKVTTLSGGERQRAAIARAILLDPKVVLADEPTGNLDERTGSLIGKLLVSLNRDLGMTLVLVTHNQDLAGLMSRRLELRSGELYEHQ